MMIDHVKKVLADPKRVCPAYDEKAGYELAGFVWLQGFNDLVDGRLIPDLTNPENTTNTQTCWPLHSRCAQRPVSPEDAIRDRRAGSRR
jgi:hypothetical protein